MTLYADMTRITQNINFWICRTDMRQYTLYCEVYLDYDHLKNKNDFKSLLLFFQ